MGWQNIYLVIHPPAEHLQWKKKKKKRPCMFDEEETYYLIELFVCLNACNEQDEEETEENAFFLHATPSSLHSFTHSNIE